VDLPNNTNIATKCYTLFKKGFLLDISPGITFIDNKSSKLTTISGEYVFNNSE